MMTMLEQIAKTALEGNSLATRSMMQDWLLSEPDLASLSSPVSQDPRIRSLTAALAELIAQRLGQPPPSWAAGIGPAPEAIYLLKSAKQMRRLRDMCEQSAPMPLKKRGFFAPANYLEAV